MVSRAKRSAIRVTGVLGVAAAILVGANYLPESIKLPPPPPPLSSGQESLRAPIDRIATVCPGPEQQGLEDAAVDEVEQRVDVEAMAAPAPVVEAALAAADFRGAPPSLDQGSLAVMPLGSLRAGAGSSVDERGVAAGISLTSAEGAAALALGGLAPGVSATQMYVGEEEGLLGLALTPCVAARDEVWLVGGGGESGRSERLVLMNPGQSALAASVQVWGVDREPMGEVGDSGVALEPGERDVILVDALAPGEAAPVVHVVSTGGPISAYLGDRALDGTTDLGWESAAPVGAPATSHVIPAIVIPQGAPTDARVRVAVTGEDPAVVEVGAWGPDGAVTLAQAVTVVPGQRSVDISLSDVLPGTYALAVSSDVDIVAAASVSSAPDPSGRRDFSWAAPAPALTSLAGAPLPQPDQSGPVEYALDLVAPDGGSATVFTLDNAGVLTSVDVVLESQIVSTSDLPGATGVWVVPGENQVFASVRGNADVTRTAEEAEATAAPAKKDPDAVVSVTSVFALDNLDLIRSVAEIAPALP